MKKNKPDIHQLLLSSLFIWISTILLGFSIAALFLGKMGYGFALARVKWFVDLWDKRILPLSAAIKFQHIWWLILIGAMILGLLLIQPWTLHQRGRRISRLLALIIVYALFYTLWILFAWQLQYYLFNSGWLLIVSLFIICHFLSIFSLGILTSITNRIPSLNEEYINQTERIILTESDPLDLIFHKSLYGYIVQRMSGQLFDLLTEGIFGLFAQTKRKQRIYARSRSYFCKLFYLLSCAWLFDYLFGSQYYVMHFEMVLKVLVYQEEYKAWQVLVEKGLHPALISCAVEGLFAQQDEWEKSMSEEDPCTR